MEIFIISAEKTVPIANPLSGNRVGDAVLHYKPADGTIPLPINSRPSNRGHGLYFATTLTTASPAEGFVFYPKPFILNSAHLCTLFLQIKEYFDIDFFIQFFRWTKKSATHRTNKA